MDIIDRLHGDALTHTLTDDAIAEIERLRTDKESLMVGRDFLMAEIEKLKDELAECRKDAMPDCKICQHYFYDHSRARPTCDGRWITRDLCVNGNHYKAVFPTRLYAINADNH